MDKAKSTMTALVTGASGGLGAAFSEELAGMGFSLFLSGRDEKKLHELGAKLAETHNVEASVLAADLAQPGASRTLWEKTEGAGHPVDVLVNNAGFAHHGGFLDIPEGAVEAQLSVLIRAPTELCRAFAAAMRERRLGFVLNVSSFTAFVPTPRYAVYAAAKAYLRHFSEALAEELCRDGVVVSCLCPGSMLTPFFERAGHRPDPLITATMMTPRDVARQGLRGLFKRKRLIVPGGWNKFGRFGLMLLSRRRAVKLAERFSRQYTG
jgi:short-subunit dehydrogenase